MYKFRFRFFIFSHIFLPLLNEILMPESNREGKVFWKLKIYELSKTNVPKISKLP